MAESGGNKRLSVERIYQKKSQLEHILLRPDTYIGSVQVWLGSEGIGMSNFFAVLPVGGKFSGYMAKVWPLICHMES